MLLGVERRPVRTAEGEGRREDLLMGHFKHVCLLKAPQVFDIPHAQDVSDLTEICCLAGAVENEVESVSIPVDFYSRDPYGQLASFLKGHPVDLVGISTMTGAYNNALRLAEIAKRADAYVVMGGYHPTALPEEVLTSPHVDAVVIGEGDETFRELAVRGPSKDVAGMAFRENGGVVRTEPRPLIADLDSLPFPLRSARPRRFGEAGDDYSIDTVYTSRGCPWRCTFCANNTVNKRWRARSPENVIEELARLHDPNRRKLIKIWDANFLTNVNRVERLCDLMLETGLTNFKIWTETRVADVVRAKGILPKMYRAGFRHMSLGIESPNAETLKLMNKGNTDPDCGEAVRLLLVHKIRPQGYFIIGHYTETEEETKRHAEYAEWLGLHHAIFMVMTPYPGTVVYEEYTRENKIRSHDWDLYNNFAAVVETRGMDFDGLKRMYAYCWGRFYTRWALMHDKRLLGMTITLVRYMLVAYTLFRSNKHTRDETRDRLVDYLKAGCRDVTRFVEWKAPLFVRWLGEFVVRFRCPGGENVEFRITQRGTERTLSGRTTRDSGPIKGFTFDVDDVVDLGERLDAKSNAILACKLDTMKSNPHRLLANLLSVATDGELIRMGLHVFGFFAAHFVKAVGSTLRCCLGRGRKAVR